uniref:Dihydrolipoyl dehydrogenase n=1 Tax=Candidatus Kentrum sp. LFY TaxID=2126342 RepID=A0A450WDP5_9GAMM|nr:MAG: dihydrolipoamide dehydrogenase [Candidatus Kentron sp. LFY]
MGKITIIEVPDLGDFKDVEVIEVLISPGDRIEPETPLITLESDKATMEVPSPEGGVIKEIEVAVGDKVSMGSPIASVEVEAEGRAADSLGDAPRTPASAKKTPPETRDPEQKAPRRKISGQKTKTISADIDTEVVVLGAGPGGYTAAFRVADLGKKTVLVERYPDLGGVCLNVGCIPSKACLHTAHILDEAREMAARGVAFGEPVIDLPKLAVWKNRLVDRLSKGIAGLAKRRKVRVLQGIGEFLSPNVLTVQTVDGPMTVAFDHAVIAVGSRSTEIADFPRDSRIWTSTDALKLDTIPKRLLVVGGGVIGLEMATVYHALGSRITVVELQDNLIPGCDADLVRVLRKHIGKRYENIFTGTSVTGIIPREKGLEVSLSGKDAPESDTFDAVLVSVGRTPNGREIAPDKAGVLVDERGFIPVDRGQRTNIAHIFAVGDVVGQPMLAHKAVHEAKVAAEVIAGLPSRFDARAIPSVAYTDPELAWMGITENDAKARGIAYDKGVFPWAASGRALGMGRDEGMTRLLFEKDTGRVIGAGIVGPHAGDLISEAVLALEMGANAEDLGMIIHPHPTLSETLGFSAEMITGAITDLMPPRGR